MELKLKGLKKLSSETKNLSGYYSGKYIQVNYDPKTNEIWGDYHYSLGHNTWTVYHDENIINCGNVYEPCTMKYLIKYGASGNNFIKKEI